MRELEKPSDAGLYEKKPFRLSPCALAVSVMMSLMLCVALFASIRNVVLEFFVDDAFFYLEIARRMGCGQGSTYDGITHTNGYHPLWQILLVAFAPVMTASRDAGIRVVMALCVLLLIVALVLIYRLARQLAPIGADAALFFTACSLVFASIYGMETALSVAIMAYLLTLLGAPTMVRSVRGGATIGAVSSALFLSRLDSLTYIIAMDLVFVAFLARQTGSNKSWNALVVCLGIQVFVVVSYFAFNEIQYGHLITISALAKMDRRDGISLKWLSAPMVIAGMSSAMLGVVALRLRKAAVESLPVYVSAFGTLASVVLSLITATPELRMWYFALPVLCGCLHIAVIIDGCGAGVLRSVAFRATIVIGVLMLVISVYGKSSHSRSARIFSVRRMGYDRAQWLRKYSPTDSVFTSSDSALVGYMSDRSNIDNDGLANSYGYRDAIRSSRLPEWFRLHGLNSAVFPANEKILRTCDGKFLHDVPIRPGREYGRPKVRLVLTPVDIPHADKSLRLWHIVAVEAGDSKDADACTAAEADKAPQISHATDSAE